jgi:hypothetical protein
MLLAANVQTQHRIRPESRLPINTSPALGWIPLWKGVLQLISLPAAFGGRVHRPVDC